MKITGRIQGGKFIGDNPASWPIVAREHEGKAVTLKIEPLRSRRSQRANDRYWTVLNPLAGHYLSLNRPIPFNKDEVHAVLVTAFAGSDETELGLVPVRTRTMDSKQFHTFTERVSLWLREKGYPVPEGPDVSVAEAIQEAMA